MTKKNLTDWMNQINIVIPAFLLSSYKKMGLSETEVMLLLHIQNFGQHGNFFPTPFEISMQMNVTETDCSDLLRKLIQKGYLEMSEEVSDEQILYEKYSLAPLYEKMSHYFLKNANDEEVIEQQNKSENLYTIFESEFARPLSPFEAETLSMWLDVDGHTPELIKAALREAVISGKLNFRYIDRILFEWKRKGVQTIQQAKQQGERFRSQHSKKESVTKANVKELPLYNWLES